MNGQLAIERADVVNFQCDVLVLKHAQEFYGADGAVARLLPLDAASSLIAPAPGEHVLVPAKGSIGAEKVLFVGTPNLRMFDYGAIRSFATRAMRILAKEMPHATHIAMTMHGVGFGLDEREAFLAQIAGLADAFQAGDVPTSLQRLSIVERSKGRAERLKQILNDYLPEASPAPAQPDGTLVHPTQDMAGVAIDAGVQSNAKPHIFVAMPFSKDMEDVYIFGIQGPTNSADFLCERVDMATFTGDILEHIKTRIETATLVIADLTGANANVYLEVGYAWGKNRPTLLLTRREEDLKFDVKGQKCIIYENIFDLSQKLTAVLNKLKDHK